MTVEDKRKKRVRSSSDHSFVSTTNVCFDTFYLQMAPSIRRLVIHNEDKKCEINTKKLEIAFTSTKIAFSKKYQKNAEEI